MRKILNCFGEITLRRYHWSEWQLESCLCHDARAFETTIGVGLCQLQLGRAFRFAH
jgi:hypothetical protein